MNDGSTWLRRLNRFVALLLAGGALFLCMAQAEFLVLPEKWGIAGRFLYRAAFFVVLPFRALVSLVLPPEHHHLSLLNLLVSCAGTPFFLWILWRLGQKAITYARRLRSAENEPEKSSFVARRQFLVRSTLSTAGMVMGGVGGYAAFVEPGELRVRHYVQAITGLPWSLHGISLVQISDTHYGPFTSLRYLEGVVESANRLRPDLMVLTGDYVHMTPRSIKPGVELLEGLRASFGCVAVLGNHDHWEGAKACRKVFRRIGIPLIDNDRMFLTDSGLTERGDRGRSLCIAGVGDLWTDRVSPPDALGGVADETPRLLLSHNPDVAENFSPDFRVDLMLSGHTHGGQVRLPIIGAPTSMTKYGEKYLGGLCHGPLFPVIVSRGIGMTAVPVRFRVPPELCKITLVRADTTLAKRPRKGPAPA